MVNVNVTGGEMYSGRDKFIYWQGTEALPWKDYPDYRPKNRRRLCWSWLSLCRRAFSAYKKNNRLSCWNSRQI